MLAIWLAQLTTIIDWTFVHVCIPGHMAYPYAELAVSFHWVFIIVITLALNCWDVVLCVCLRVSVYVHVDKTVAHPRRRSGGRSHRLDCRAGRSFKESELHRVASNSGWHSAQRCRWPAGHLLRWVVTRYMSHWCVVLSRWTHAKHCYQCSLRTWCPPTWKTWKSQEIWK